MIDDLHLQADYCQATSPLYGALFETLADIAKARDDGQNEPALAGFFDTVNTCWQGRKFNEFFERPLLLAGALHEQVLQGNAPELAPFYASCGGHYQRHDHHRFEQAIKTTLAKRHQDMASFLSQKTIQTNETSRGLAWLLPLLASWLKGQPTVTLIELGCSAGLGLVADQYGYQVHGPAGQVWSQEGDPRFEITFCGAGAKRAHSSLAHLPDFSAALRERIGCDLNPLDCRKADQQRILEALIWPDNVPRLERLRAAIDTQQRSKLRFETGDMVDCVQRLSRQSFDNTPMMCIFNTVATCYLENAHYVQLSKAIASAFHGPWAGKDCLWIEFEMPRADEVLPDFAQNKEMLIKGHRRGEAGGLKTQYFGAAKAHVTEIEVF